MVKHKVSYLIRDKKSKKYLRWHNGPYWDLMLIDVKHANKCRSLEEANTLLSTSITESLSKRGRRDYVDGKLSTIPDVNVTEVADVGSWNTFVIREVSDFEIVKETTTTTTRIVRRRV